MAKTKTQKKSGQTLQVRVLLEQPPNDMSWDRLAAYLHTRSGRLLAKAQLVAAEGEGWDEGVASFVLPKTPPKTLIVKVGPNTENRRELAGKELLVRRVLVTPSDKLHTELTVHPEHWKKWLVRPYVVTGKVEKSQDGDMLPVCHGEVDIFDVDVRCLLRLPDSVIEEIRRSFLDLVIDPLPIDGQRLKTSYKSNFNYVREHDYGVVGMSGLMSQVANRIVWCGTPPRPLPRKWLNPRYLRAQLQVFAPDLAPRVDAVDTAAGRVEALMDQMGPLDRQAWLAGDAAEGVKVSQLVHTTTEQFRHLLVERFEPFRFWLCGCPWIYWRWWPYCYPYGLQHLGTAKLEAEGQFQKTVWLPIFRRDTPDLWFSVRQRISGVERTIYGRHPVLCHTFWNHPNGEPVHLRVTDSEAAACKGPTPDHDAYVMPLGIGNDGWDEIDYPQLTNEVDRTQYELHGGLHNGSDPYGTRLDLQMQFHDELRQRGIRYYRWSYHLEGTQPEFWTSISAPVTHRYLDEIDDEYYLVNEQLGPKTVGSEHDLFEVPDPEKYWVVVNRNDRAAAIWHTALWDARLGRFVPQVPNGRYMLRLQMFDEQGSVVRPSDSTFRYLLPSGPADGGPLPVDSDLSVLADGSVIFRLFVDNRDTTANIKSVGLGGTATQECQFMEYADREHDEVTVTFEADHHPGPPRDFIDRYGLSIRRGVSGIGVGSANQTFAAPGESTTPPYDPPGEIVKTFKVDDLLRATGGKGPFSRCSFAVHLHTYPRTRDGYGRIRAYESSDSSTFALVEGDS